MNARERRALSGRLCVAGAMLAVGVAVTLAGERALVLPAGVRVGIGFAAIATYAVFAAAMLRAHARLGRSTDAEFRRGI